MSTFEDLQDMPPRPGLAALKRLALGGVIVMLAVAASVATATLLQVKDASDIFKRYSRDPIAKGALDDVKPGGPQTIMILGSDRRYQDIKQKNPTRSDTIILMRLDPSKGATAVMSIPRDLKVKINLGGRRGLVTDKINAAYALGGPTLTVKTVRNLLHIPINHVVNVNFGGFRRAVNRLKCVYVDVDRRYFNDNNPPAGGGPDYAVIDVKPGYQKLCGQDALDYVRYRHFDTDLVRASRQQDFLRQAKDQIGVGKLFSDRKELLRIFATYTQTDIRGTTPILRLLKLAVESAKNPIRQVHFKSTEGESYVTATPRQISANADAFSNARATGTAGAKAKARPGDERAKRKTSKKSSARFPGLFNAKTQAETQAINVAVKSHFPVYYPTLAALGSSYVTDADSPRVYTISNRNGRTFRAYRMVVRAPGIGQYYGIQGTTWTNAPLLDHPSETTQMRGRKYDLFYDGNRLRLIAFRRAKAVYWVSNTLLETLSNKKMMGIARSLQRVGT